MQTDHLDLQPPDLVNQNIEKMCQLFPNWVTESAEDNAFDFNLLCQELSTPPQVLSTPLRNRIEKTILERINQLSPETEMKVI